MKKEIVINATTNEIRVAILEDEKLSEVFLEVADKESRIGSIYLGKVQRVVQGMNAAFVDIGEEQHAFLHFSDVGNASDDFDDDKEGDDDSDEDADIESVPAKKAPRKAPAREPAELKAAALISEESPIQDGRGVSAPGKPPRKNARTDRARPERSNRKEQPTPDVAPSEFSEASGQVSASENASQHSREDSRPHEEAARPERQGRNDRGGRSNRRDNPKRPDLRIPRETSFDQGFPPHELPSRDIPTQFEPGFRDDDFPVPIARVDRYDEPNRNDEESISNIAEQSHSGIEQRNSGQKNRDSGTTFDRGNERRQNERGDRREDQSRVPVPYMEDEESITETQHGTEGSGEQSQGGERETEAQKKKRRRGRRGRNRGRGRDRDDTRGGEGITPPEGSHQAPPVSGQVVGPMHGPREENPERRNDRGDRRNNRGNNRGNDRHNRPQSQEQRGPDQRGQDRRADDSRHIRTETVPISPRDERRERDLNVAGEPKSGREIDLPRDADRSVPAMTSSGEPRNQPLPRPERGNEARPEKGNEMRPERGNEARPERGNEAHRQPQDNNRPGRDDRNRRPQGPPPSAPRHDQRPQVGGVTKPEALRGKGPAVPRSNMPPVEKRRGLDNRTREEQIRDQQIAAGIIPKGGPGRPGPKVPGARPPGIKGPGSRTPGGPRKPRPDRNPRVPSLFDTKQPSPKAKRELERDEPQNVYHSTAPKPPGSGRFHEPPPSLASAADIPKLPARKRASRAVVKPDAGIPPATLTPVTGIPPTEKPTPRRRGPGKKKGPEGGGAQTMDAKLPTFQTKRSGEVTIALERNQDIIVQVTRESYAQKGVRVSTKVSLPGRFLVLLPLEASIGVSRKVQSSKERRRLRKIASSILPEGYGCIIRTNAENKDGELIREDLTKLIDNWRAVEEKMKTVKSPAPLYSDQSVANTVMRDLFTPDISRVIIDNKGMYKQIREYVEWAAPALANNIELYTGPKPIFDAFGVERELDKMFQRRCYLPSGGYIILDQTEAMMVIDVNSGRFADKTDQEMTSLRTNVEAAREIARQIRLRDIAGLLVVDFIDLYDERNRKKVYDELRNAMRRDRAKSVVLPMTQFGLVQMTRQRVRQQILQTMSEPCPLCEGAGMIQSKSTVVRKIERWLQRFKGNSREFRLILRVNPDLVDFLTEGGAVCRLSTLMMRYFVRIKLVPDETLPVDGFAFVSIRQQEDVTDKFLVENGHH